MTDIITLVLTAGCFICLIILIIRGSGSKLKIDEEMVKHSVENTLQSFGVMMTRTQREIGNIQSDKFILMENSLENTRKTLERQLDKMRSDTASEISALRNENTALLEKMRTENNIAFDKMRSDNTQSLEKIRRDNGEQLEKMRETVDEKLQETLQSRLTQSFKVVSDRLEQVYKGLGEMQTLAQGVGDLKKVLSNVKTRGILGEIQLGSILEQIMSPEQYDSNIATVPNSKNVVEFAIKLPDKDGGITYMPIDSKFPGDTYSMLVDAYASGDKSAVDAAAKSLRSRILAEARDIHSKYVSPPHTTDFAIMFLPFEGLYAEVVNRGLVEELQNTYKIMIAGPSTMAAMLNSIQMGFKTLAIEKRSTEVWNILGAVKTEFGKFDKILQSTQKRLTQANEDLDKLIGVRTRAIVRKLGSVEKTEFDSDLFGYEEQLQITDDE